MSCQETVAVIHEYLDGELDQVRTLAIEQHLRNCPACARACRERQSLGKALADRSLYFNAPRALEPRVRRAISRAAKSEARREYWHWRWKWRWPNVLAPLAAAALVMLVALPLATRHATEDRLADEILTAHVRSLMVEHKVDVVSSDQHTVKPWFDGKLDFAPPVLNLAAQGFPLVGGRLDYLAERPVAALVYQHHQHFINLFVWPAVGSSSAAEKTTIRRGYNLIGWTASGMTFWAVSDLNRTELGEFTRLIQF